MAKSYVWFICTACRSRLAVERGHTGEIRCRNCSTLLRPAKETTGTVKSDKAAQHGGEDDEYRLAPTTNLHSANGPSPGATAGAAPVVYDSELQRLRAKREHIADEAPAHEATAPTGKPVWLDPASIRDDERYKPAPPPQWTFFSGIFTYPWRPQSILPWVVLSFGIALWGVMGLLVVSGVQSGSQPGAVMAGFLALGWIWLTILAGSYAAACVYAVTENTAYNFDTPHDWPEPDWKERFFHLLWLGWCLGLPLALIIPVASVVAENLQDRASIVVLGAAVLFPIFVLSTLETNSLSPLSGAVWRSLWSEGISWTAFYLVSSLVLGGMGFITVVLYRRLGLLSVLPLGPLWSAAILIYARLLGRLAWRIMRPSEMQLQAWRKAQQSTLAAEVRQRLRGEESFASDDE